MFYLETQKGGSTCTRWTNAPFLRSWIWVIQSSHHTTDVYATNAAGEVLPPLYILYTKAKMVENYTIATGVVESLLIGMGKYGLFEEKMFGLYVAVHPKRSMDNSL